MAKFRVNNNGTIIEFDTQAEHDAWVANHSPHPDMTNLIKSFQAEEVGKQVVRDLWAALKAQNLSQVNEADLLNRIYPVLTALSVGFINGARSMANALTVAGQLTQGRKDFLVTAIDGAITANPLNVGAGGKA